MLDEGYIKFQATWVEKPALSPTRLNDIIACRTLMYENQLIGAYPDGIGFGNISQRAQGDEFIISGSATGNFAEVNPQHFSMVTSFDIDKNQVYCEGPIIASSESMSHAVIYQQCSEINAVIHAHHLGMWKKWKDILPTTNKAAAYGTPEMAREIIRLLQETTVRREQQIFVMAGHLEGIIAFGTSLEKAANNILMHLT